MRYDELSNVYATPEAQQVLAEFATGAFRLFNEKYIMLDICDAGGIRGKKKRDRTNIFSVDDAITMLDSSGNLDAEVLPSVRNTAFVDGKVILYDTYPVTDVHELTNDGEFVLRCIECIRDGRNEELKSLAINMETNKIDRQKLQVIRYLALLKYLGADFSEE